MGQKSSHCCHHSEDSVKVLDLAVALHPFRARGHNELSFDRGNKLEVISKDGKEWWLARYPGHHCLGYIPLSHVAVIPYHESQEWYHGEMRREEAEPILLSKINPQGAFLVRKSSRINAFVLSMKGLSADSITPDIRHYRINKINGQYIVGYQTFLTLSEVVGWFSTRQAAGLPKLSPCVTTILTRDQVFRRAKGQWELHREEAGLEKMRDTSMSSALRIGNRCSDIAMKRTSYSYLPLGQKTKDNAPLSLTAKKDQSMTAFDIAEHQVMKSLSHTDNTPIYTEYTISENEPLIPSDGNTCPKKP